MKYVEDSVSTIFAGQKYFFCNFESGSLLINTEAATYLKVKLDKRLSWSLP